MMANWLGMMWSPGNRYLEGEEGVGEGGGGGGRRRGEGGEEGGGEEEGEGGGGEGGGEEEGERGESLSSHSTNMLIYISSL